VVILRHALILTMLAATTGIVAQTSIMEKPLVPVSVCEVLGNRGLYNGKKVAVIGRRSSTDEGSWVIGDCGNEIKTGDYLWDNITYLEYDPSSPTAFPDGIRLDDAAVNKEIAELKRRMKPSKEKVEWVVVYGRVETQEELPTVVAGDGKSVFPAGYGHLNGAPAQVIYKAKDLIIIPSK
jgi:hypothetical protein